MKEVSGRAAKRVDNIEGKLGKVDDDASSEIKQIKGQMGNAEKEGESYFEEMGNIKTELEQKIEKSAIENKTQTATADQNLQVPILSSSGPTSAPRQSQKEDKKNLKLGQPLLWKL